MSDQPSANHATTFKLALLAMLVSIWLVGRVSEPDAPEPVVDELGFVIETPVDPDADEQIVPLVKVEEIDANAPGSVVGFVRFAGEKLPPKPLSLEGDSYCKSLYNEKSALTSERWVWGEKDTVQNVLVLVTKGLPDRQWDSPVLTSIIQIEGCRFIPHINAVMPGQLIEFHNLDFTPHEVKVLPAAGNASLFRLPMRGNIAPWMPDQSELGIQIKCERIPFMESYVHVIPHPFFSLTGPQGSFEIKNLPPGEYEISLWHEVRSFRNSVKPMTVKVEPGKTTQIELTIEPARSTATSQD